jgi:hypothetical protein
MVNINNTGTKDCLLIHDLLYIFMQRGRTGLYVLTLENSLLW